MFANEIRRAAEAAARVELPKVSAALWQAFAAGHVTEGEAESLSALIEARRAVPAVIVPLRKPVGSRPRTDASLERRRRWAASGRLPPAIAARFTLAEQAVLAVISVEVAQRGDCRLPVGRIAAVAGVGETSVRRALRTAQSFGLVTIEERRLSAWRSDTNIVRVISPEWQAWMRLARPGGGGRQSAQASDTCYSEKGLKLSKRVGKKLPGRQVRIHQSGIAGTSEGGGSRKAYVLGA